MSDRTIREMIEAVRMAAHDERNDRGPSRLQVEALALCERVEALRGKMAEGSSVSPGLRAITECPVCGFAPKK